MTCISSYTQLRPLLTIKMFFGIRGKFVLSSPTDKWAEETCAGCPLQRYIPGEPGNVQGRDCVDIVDGSCGYRARGVSIRGKYVFIEKPGVQDEGVAMWLNVVLTPG